MDSTLDAILGIVRRYPLGSENDNRHRQARGTKGIIAKISTELALNDVNLVGIICNSPEDILLVTEADAPRALEALQRMLGEEAMSTNQKREASKIVLPN